MHTENILAYRKYTSRKKEEYYKHAIIRCIISNVSINLKREICLCNIYSALYTQLHMLQCTNCRICSFNY